MSEKEYNNVIDMIRDSANDIELANEVEENLSRRKIIQQLLVQRAVQGMSQSYIAKKLRRSQSWVSKLENGVDDDIRYGDFREYAAALNCSFNSNLIPSNMTPVDKVKCHVFTINKHMEDMADLAQNDTEIAGGVAKFFHELFFNFAHILGRTALALPKRADGSPYIQIQVTTPNELEETGNSSKQNPENDDSIICAS